MNTSTSKKGATSMAELMKSANTTFISPKKGELIEGTITKLSSNEITVSIGAKAEAIVLEREKRILNVILQNLKVGDKVNVSVLSPESEMGNPIVSLRRYVDDIIWEKLEKLRKSKEKVNAKITDTTKGGFIIETPDGITGFLPNSQTDFTDLGQTPLGKEVKAFVLELNRPNKKIIFSQKSVTSKDLDEITKKVKIDQKIDAIISGVVPFGLFVTMKIDDTDAEGFIHASEISWEKADEQFISENFKAGDRIEAKVIGFDKKAGRVNLSIKQLTEDPYQKELEKFELEKRVTATVSNISDAGITLALSEGIEGFIKKDKIPPKMSFKEGSEVTATVSEVDKKKHRVILVPVLKEKPIGYR